MQRFEIDQRDTRQQLGEEDDRLGSAPEEHGDSLSTPQPDSLAQFSLGRRGKLMRWLFPATVSLSGTGPIVLIDALERSTDEIVAAIPLLPQRSIVATNDPNVAPLRAAGVVYEYLPRATPDGRHEAEDLSDRLTWIDYVYGVEEVRALPLVGGPD